MEIFTCFVWCSLILFYYVIKMEIKQLKRFFFCHYFNLVLSRNSYTTSILQMYIVGNLVQRNSTCILYFGYVELRITRNIFSIPLDFEITRLTCIWSFEGMLMIHLEHLYAYLCPLRFFSKLFAANYLLQIIITYIKCVVILSLF